MKVFLQRDFSSKAHPSYNLQANFLERAAPLAPIRILILESSRSQLAIDLKPLKTILDSFLSLFVSVIEQSPNLNGRARMPAPQDYALQDGVPQDYCRIGILN